MTHRRAAHGRRDASEGDAGVAPTGFPMPHDQFLDPPLPDVIAQWTRYVEALDPRPGDRVLDVGCGSGDPDVLLLRLRPEVGAVVGLDPSGARLANARR